MRLFCHVIFSLAEENKTTIFNGVKMEDGHLVSLWNFTWRDAEDTVRGGFGDDGLPEPHPSQRRQLFATVHPLATHNIIQYIVDECFFTPYILGRLFVQPIKDPDPTTYATTSGVAKHTLNSLNEGVAVPGSMGQGVKRVDRLFLPFLY